MYTSANYYVDEKEGLFLVAQVLKENSSLKLLDLSSNEIEDEGASAVAEALKVNSCLK
jgi:Leucine Rich repeat